MMTEAHESGLLNPTKTILSPRHDDVDLGGASSFPTTCVLQDSLHPVRDGGARAIEDTPVAVLSKLSHREHDDRGRTSTKRGKQ